MKLRILFAFIISLLIVQETFSQWTVNTGASLSNYVTINSVHFINENTGFVGGSNAIFGGEGRLSKTSNGGTTWKVVLTESDAAIHDIFFVNNSLGFAVGNDGLISKTIDGGETWTSQRLTGIFGVEPFRAVFFANANIGYAVGGDMFELIFKTSDGGATWSQVAYFLSFQELNDVHFIDSNTGIAVGGNQFSGRSIIYRTINGGTSWDTVSYTGNTYFNTVHFVDANTGFIGGGLGAILKTTNGGISWVSVSNQDPTKAAITAIDFIDATFGFATTQTGRILKTVDGGNTWTIDANVSNGISSLYDISVVSPAKGIAVGLSGSYAVKANTTGMETAEIKNLKITPNPTKNELKINFDTQITNAKLTIFNMNGQVAFEHENLNKNTTITLPQMADGIYILTIQHQEGTHQQKLVITK